MTTKPIFSLKKGDMLTVETLGKKTLHGEFTLQQNNSWQIRMLQTQMNRLIESEELRLSFIRGQLLYTGATELISVNEKTHVCTFSQPTEFTSRPVRRIPRIVSNVAAGVIYHNPNNEHSRRHYSTRDQNRIIDLTVEGAKLSCRKPIGDSDSEVIIVTCFEDNPNCANAQVYYHATIIREIKDHTSNEYPYAYGLKFKALVPESEQALQNYLSELIGEPLVYQQA